LGPPSEGALDTLENRWDADLGERIGNWDFRLNRKKCFGIHPARIAVVVTEE